jgi:pimeloyl-ACP methyl ester carboxylesterase
MDGTVEFVEQDGVRIAYRRVVPVGIGDDDVPVVLLHALAEDSTTWNDLRTQLASAGRSSIAIDLRGHGQSSWPGSYSFELMVNDVIALVDELGVVTFDLVGHSLGGHLSLYLAGLYPDRVRRLVVEDAPPPPEALVVDVDAPTKPSVPVPFDWGVVELRQMIRTPDRLWWERLRKIQSPTLIVGGGAASQVDQDRLRQVGDTIAHCRFVTINVGHSIHRAEPARFAQLVLDALG